MGEVWEYSIPYKTDARRRYVYLSDVLAAMRCRDDLSGRLNWDSFTAQDADIILAEWQGVPEERVYKG